MKRILLSFFLLIGMAQFSFAQEFEVIDLELANPAGGIIIGDLSKGATMPIRWAADSQMACFPATRFYEFKGNHILYRIQMPAYSELKITVTPKSKRRRINVYALRLGINNYGSLPGLTSAISCEASYPIYAGTPNIKAPSKPQSVEYISVNKPYNILIGVAGAEGVLDGEYKLEVEIKSR